MDSFNKIYDKYGIGAGMQYLEKRQKEKQEESTKNNQSFQERYDEALDIASKDLKFKMTNYLRQNEKIYSDEDKEYLNGIIKQTNYISRVSNAYLLTEEWNGFCYKKEFVYYLCDCIKNNKDYWIDKIKKYNPNLSSAVIDEISSDLDSLTSISDYDKFVIEYKDITKSIKKKITKYRKIFKLLINKEKEVKYDWKKR